MNDDEFAMMDVETERYHLERFDPDEAEGPKETEVPQEEILEVERGLKAQRRTDLEVQSARIESTILSLKTLLGHDDRDVQQVEKRLVTLKQQVEAELALPDEPWTEQTR